MGAMETEIRINLTVLDKTYKSELEINPDVAERYRFKAHGLRQGLELAFSKKFLKPIFDDFPALWVDYDE